MKIFTSITAFIFLLVGTSLSAQMGDKMHKAEGMMKDEVTVIKLEQTAGQYETTSLDLAPGKYIFEVTNKSVDKGLGFLLTPTSDAKAQVANSGLENLVKKGETSRSGIVELVAGDYQYTCPLNPTPQYSLKVSDKMDKAQGMMKEKKGKAEGMMKDKMHKADGMMKDGITVIKLEQTAGQYETTSLDLAPGKYIFEVTNKSVDKGLGFLLTPTSDAKAQVVNSGLENLVKKGETSRSGVVELTAGNYQYTCPLNPTPQYSLTVTDKM